MSKAGLKKREQMEVVSKKLYVKYMVSLRCKLILKEELKNLNIKYSISVHGAIIFHEAITEYRLNELNQNLQKSGLLLLDEPNSLLIDKIINTIIEVIHYSEELPKVNFSDVISDKLGSDNESILKIFSDVKGMSVMQFIILQKIERIKELLLYKELTLQEIAKKLYYKNEDLLIAQFKKHTGLTPAYFKKLRKERLNLSEGVRSS
ncbi:MAG: helix-turn-helix domain-containing protein [Balneolaceae bacterium]|nr:helix-turn-helix domain-containing protein [Balneolaceae bacterium]